MDERELAIRAAADHVSRLKQRLQAGQTEIARQHASVSQIREHMAGISRWIEETDRLLEEDRVRRARNASPPAAG
jgi:phage shock protein A